MKVSIKNKIHIGFMQSFGIDCCRLNLVIAWTFVPLAYCLSSCRKFLDIPPPVTQLVTASVFNDGPTATAAQLTIYTQMWGNAESFNMAVDLGLYSDELQNYSATPNNLALYTNSLLAVNNSTWNTYVGGNNYYLYIYEANAIISGLQSTSGVSAVVKQQLIGEAYFIRAFWHFYLTEIYGDVPLALTTDYTVTSTLPRTPRLQVLQQVVNDLKVADSLLNAGYIDASDTTITTERTRPNKAAAMALLARAYLYIGDYSKDASYFVNAATAASSVIVNPQYSLTNLNNVFLANSSEAIWQLQTPQPPPNADTYDGEYFILLGAPQNRGSNNSTTISDQLLSTFETGDLRKINWIDSITEGPSAYYFPYKYKNYLYIGTEYNTVLRLSEQYLIRAEAEANVGDSTDAISDLNVIRARAGLSSYADTTQGSLLSAILHERQVELFTEWGHRWFDLCRSGNAISVMSTVCPQKGGTWNPNGYQVLFPIPKTELINDVNLTQNPGY